MRKILKNVCITMIISLLLCTVSFSAFATENNDVKAISSNSEIMPMSNSYYPNGITVKTSWKTVASSSSGFNCNVWIQSLATGTVGLGIAPTDIRMLNKSGTVVWSESAAIAGVGHRIFWCGSDVYTIQARAQSGATTIITHQS